MPQLLLELLPELMEHIYSYCSTSDLLNIACCDKEHNSSMQFRLWCSIKLPWNIEMESLSSKTKQQFKFVRHLIFCDNNEYMYQPTANQWDLVASNYKDVLEYCDTRKLTSLKLNIICSDRTLEVTGDIFKNLQELSLYKCQGITESGWNIISTFSDLKQLDIFQCGVQDEDIKGIVDKLSLKKLILNQCKELSSGCLKYISLLTSLETLSLSCWQFKDVEFGLSELSTMKSLRILGITGYYNATNDAIGFLSLLRSLSELDLSCSSNLNDSGLLTLSSLPHLKKLNICDCGKVTDAGISNLAVMPFLQVLNVSGCWKLSDFALSQLKHVTTLRELNIGGCRFITDVGISHLVNIQSLKRLNISGCFYVTDIGLAELSDLTSLGELSVGACCITDLGICQLTFLPVLESLSISECHRVTDFGLAEISRISSLKRLNIIGCINITFIGLVQLTDLRLDELNIRHCGLSDEMVAQFCLYSGMKELFGPDGCMNSRILTRNYRLWTKQQQKWENDIEGEL